MKSYKEIAENVFERREQYEKEKMKKRKIVRKTVAPICCVCLAVMLGFGAWKIGLFGEKKIQTADDSIIIGEKDWYGPGEYDPRSDANIQKPTENTTNDKSNNSDKPQNSEDNLETTSNTTQNNGNDDVCEIIYSESYVYKIEEGKFSEYVGGKVIETDKVGEKIDDVSVLAGWKNTLNGWDAKEKLRGELYSVKGVEENVAVALKFVDKGEAVTTIHYYVILNPDADLSAVEEYVISNASDNAGEIVKE